MKRIQAHIANDEKSLYEEALGAILPEGFELVGSDHPADEVEVIVFEPDSGLRDFTPFTRLEFVQSIWAGVDSIVGNESLRVPLARLIDDGLRLGMREYVAGHILADHIQIKRFETADEWDDRWVPLANTKTVAIIGAGTLGQVSAEALMALGFNCVGWSRTDKALDFPHFHGLDALPDVLAQADYVVTLLPHTPETEDIVNADFLHAMKADAMLINPGRGALVDVDALLAALDGDTLRRAVLDVFKTEPLPADHPFWTHEKVLVTPHIAAKSRVDTAVNVIAENLRRLGAGEALLHLVDRKRAY